MRWLPDAEAVANTRYRARVRFGDGVRVRKEVALTVRQPTQQADRLVISVSWRATGPKGLFSIFEGEFRLRPLGPRVCRLSLTCTYEPPLGDLGRRLDEARLRRVAGATVRVFDDPMVAAAMLDRLLHRCTVFHIDGESYRMRAHRARIESLRKVVAP